jgi:hypothetical protein
MVLFLDEGLILYTFIIPLIVQNPNTIADLYNLFEVKSKRKDTSIGYEELGILTGYCINHLKPKIYQFAEIQAKDIYFLMHEAVFARTDIKPSSQYMGGFHGFQPVIRTI